MKEGKVYRIIPSKRERFVDENSCNENMLEHIDENGGSFTVLVINKEDCGRYVTKVRMANGEEFSADGLGDEYFEISNLEFEFFEEVKPEGASRGVLELKLEVDSNNAEEMIELIKKVFNK
ncbi:hypothetical protein [Enterobacter phage ZX14]